MSDYTLYFPSLSKQYPKHGGHAEEGSDGSEREGAAFAGKMREHECQQGDVASPKQGGGEQAPVAAAAKTEACQVRNCHADERDGTAERGCHCHEETAEEQEERAGAAHPYSQVSGIVIAQEQCVKGGDKGQQQQQGKENQACEERQNRQSDVGERTEAPDDELLQTVGSGIETEQADECRDGKTNHHADDEQTERSVNDATAKCQ